MTARRLPLPVAADAPLACTLDAGAARAQLDEWQAVLAAAVVSTHRDDDGATTRMTLSTDCDIAPIVELARREVACCTFFRFAIEIDAHASTLVVSVPRDAVPILDAFDTLAASGRNA